MSDSIKVASMVATLSANVTEFERGMNRASYSADKSFGSIENKAKGLRGKLDSLASNGNFFTGLKNFAAAPDLLGKLGAVGIGLGGWTLAIGASVAAGRELLGVVDGIATRIKQSQIVSLTKGTVSLAKRNAEVDAKNKGDIERSAVVLGALKPKNNEVNHAQLGIARLVGDDAAKKIIDARREAAILERDANLARLGKTVMVGEARRQAMREAGFDPNIGPARFAGVRVSGPNMFQENDFDRQAREFGKKIEQGIQQNLDRAKDIRRANAPGEVMLAISKFGEIAQRRGINPVAGEAMRQWDLAAGKVGEFAAQLENGANQIQAFADKQMAIKNELDSLNPAKIFANEMLRIEQLGVDDRNANLLRGIARRNFDAAVPAVPMMQPQFASLVRANSAEASRAILSAMLPKVKPEDRPLKELKDEAERQTEILRQIGENTARQLQPAGF
jgi:hypothetical protein